MFATRGAVAAGAGAADNVGGNVGNGSGTSGAPKKAQDHTLRCVLCFLFVSCVFFTVNFSVRCGARGDESESMPTISILVMAVWTLVVR